MILNERYTLFLLITLQGPGLQEQTVGTGWPAATPNLSRSRPAAPTTRPAICFSNWCLPAGPARLESCQRFALSGTLCYLCLHQSSAARWKDLSQPRESLTFLLAWPWPLEKHTFNYPVSNLLPRQKWIYISEPRQHARYSFTSSYKNP